MALKALQDKVKVPMAPWSSPEEVDPDSSWRGLICPIATPQSERAGEILGLAHGAIVSDGRVRHMTAEERTEYEATRQRPRC